MTLQAHEPTSRTTGLETSPRPGWYPDPLGRARLRQWTGLAWSDWVTDGTAVRLDPIVRHRPLDRSDLAHLDFVEHVFLPDAQAQGCVTPQEELRLERLLGTLRALATEGSTPGAPEPLPVRTPHDTAVGMPSASVTAPAPTAPRTPETGIPQTAWVPPAAPPLAPVSRPRSATPTARWVARTREAVGSDLALHGLAYLGVLLFFVGAFGLVVFAFGDVAPTLRPIAELVIALAPFGAAAVLLRRGATIVGRALEVVGGLLVPVMLITGFLDGYPFPPELHAVPLAVALTVLTALVAVAYAAWSARHPDSALRYLVAPVLWLSVGMATLGLGEREIPDGKGVATPSAAQTAAMLAALVVTVALARARPAHRLSAPTRTAALPGVVVLGTMAVLCWLAEGWPFLPALAGGALVLLALELVGDRIPAVVLGIVDPLWWGVVWLALTASASDLGISGATAAMAALAAGGFLAVLERAVTTRRPPVTLLLPALGMAAALVVTTSDSTWAAIAFGGASMWAAARRSVPFSVRGAARALDAAAAVLPAVALVCLAGASSVPSALLVGAVVVLAATVVARLDLVRRSPHDEYWPMWSGIGGAVVLGLSTLAWVQPTDWGDTGPRRLVVGFALLTAAALVHPLPAWLHAPVVTGVATLTWLSLTDLLDADALVTTGLLAVAGLGLVIAAHVPLGHRPDAGPFPVDRAALGLSGHALGLAAVALAVGPGWAPVVALALATAGWGMTGWLDLRDTSPVGSALARVGAPARWVPLSLTAIGIPSTLVTVDRAGWAPIDDQRSVFVVVATAVAYAVLTRFALPDRVLRVAAWAGFLAAVFAALTASSRQSMLVALAAVPVVVATLPRALRPRVMTWAAWATAAPVAGLLTAERSPWFDALPQERSVATTLAAVGTALLVGGATADLWQRPWTPLLLPRHQWALPPCVIGAVELALVVLLSVAVLPPRTGGWFVVAAASAVLVTALLSRAGIRTGVAALLGWVAVLLLAGPEIQDRPWIAVVVALGLLVLAGTLSVVTHEATWWARWDVPLLVAAAPVAATGLALAAGQPTAAATFTAVGAECLGVAAALRKHRAISSVVGVAGATLVLVGAGAASTGWLALAVLGLSVTLTALAVRAQGPARTALQLGGVTSAWVAWRLVSDWWELADQRAVEVAAIGAGVVAVVATAVAIGTRLDRSWVLVWGGGAVVAEAVCALDVLGTTGLLRGDTDPTWPVAAGLALLALSLAAAPTRLRVRWLPDLAVGYALAALLVGLLAGDVAARTQVTVLCAISVASALGVLVLSREPAQHPWRRPLLEAGLVTTPWAFVVAGRDPDGALALVPVLAAAAIQAAALGVAYRRPPVQMASPVLACAAWLVFAAQALDGNAQWVTVPIGLAVLTVVALWRRERREHGADVAAAPIVVLELVGVAFLVGSALVQTVTDSVAYAVLAAAIGLGLTVWGVVSRVRRRAAAGIVVVLVSLVLLVGVPLWGLLLPSWNAASLWILIGVAGLVALVVAGLLDWGRAATRRQLTRIADATAGWE